MIKKPFIIFSFMFLILSCGGDESSTNEVVLPQNPTIITDKTSISFDDTMVSKSSSASSILIESKNVDSSLNISSSDGFEISFNNLDFSNSLTIEANQSKTIYVRFSPSKIQTYNGNINIQNTQATDVKINLSGEGIQLKYNYKTFSKKRLAWGSGYSQGASQNFDLHNDNSNIESIKMYIRLECPSGGCDPWDRFANILVKDTDTNQWYEMARHITPYGVGNSVLDRGLEVDVTDFKSMLTGNAKQNFQILTTQIYQSRALQKFVTYNDRLNNKRKSLKVQLTNIIEQRKLTLQSMSSNLKAVSPLAVLDRGYAIVMNSKGKALKSSKEVKVGDIINTRLAEGEIISNVSKKN